MRYESRSFHAMATTIEVLAAPTLPVDVMWRVSAEFENVQTRLSRFRPSSELSRLNASAGKPFAASDLLIEVLSEALVAAEASGGLFDPVVLDAVEAAGYRQSIEHVRGTTQVQTPLRTTATYRDVRIDDGVVFIPDGSGVDLGGFAKGWTVDRAASHMDGCGSWVINAGGDLRASGPGPGEDGWIVGIEDPFVQAADVAVLRLRDVCLATSSTMRRRWWTQDGPAHHLIDPRTQRPSQTDLVSVSVVAATVADAEVLAKTLLLQGRAAATVIAASRGLSAIFVDESGTVTITTAMERHIVG